MDGRLEMGEPHPAAEEAREWIAESVPVSELYKLQEAFSNLSYQNNRLSEVCSETLRRLMNGEPVSDRYVLGLAWTIRSLLEQNGLSVVDLNANLEELMGSE